MSASATATRCSITFTLCKWVGGDMAYSGACAACDVSAWGWTLEQAHAAFDAHTAIPGPPAEVLGRELTYEDIRAYPQYFIVGRGRRVASTTQCGHGYFLTDSCPCCDAQHDKSAAI